MAKEEAAARVLFDRQAAEQAMAAFAEATGVRCEVRGKQGEQLAAQGRAQSGCEFCRLLGRQPDCGALHASGARQSERFGGRYIYFCPAGLVFFASPILVGGAREGAFLGGPVRITDEEDLLAGERFAGFDPAALESVGVLSALRCVSAATPRTLEYLSLQLFASAVYVGDSSHELFERQRENEQQSIIGQYIAQLKHLDGGDAYPIDKERVLAQAVRDADRREANRLLNELLGSIYFYLEDPEEKRARILELLVVLSRAAIEGGANATQILQLSQQFQREVRDFTTQEELTGWLATSLNRFSELMFDLLDVRHGGALARAVRYMKDHYMEKITLEEVAALAGYSPSYFSRIFKQETGQGFKEYLNRLRIERSKPLLLSGSLSSAEIGTLVGFGDQSYFCKTFRSLTGTTPEHFRKRARRIDGKKEHGEL